MYIRKVSPYIRNGCLNCRVISRVTCLFPRAVVGLIRVSVTLLQYTYNLCYLISTKIYCLYHRFGYPLAEKLYRVLKCSRYNINKKVINYLTKYYSFCQKYGRSLGQFKFTLYKNLDFNHLVYVDIMYINGSPVLYIIDKATRY